MWPVCAPYTLKHGPRQFVQVLFNPGEAIDHSAFEQASFSVVFVSRVRLGALCRVPCVSCVCWEDGSYNHVVVAVYVIVARTRGWSVVGQVAACCAFLGEQTSRKGDASNSTKCRGHYSHLLVDFRSCIRRGNVPTTHPWFVDRSPPL